MRYVLAAMILVMTMTAAALADPAPAPATAVVPAQTTVRFHLIDPVSSDKSTSGTPLRFALLDPIVVDGTTLAPAGTIGLGTLILAGHAGTSGHEGDLTLRLDTLPAADGRQITFDNQRIRINGRNKKILSGVLGFIPYAGLGARFIRGENVEIDPATPVETVLDRNAAVAAPVPPNPVALRSR
jgi:hypothetical protein